MPYHKHFKKVDPIMAKLADSYPLKAIVPAQNPLEHLVGSIISQQLSVKAADTIEKRFLGLYGGKIPSAKRIIATPIPKLRSCGISGSKAQYIKNVAEAFQKGHLNRAHLIAMSDEELRARLIAIKGVGPWTAEMYLIFALGRPDIFSPGDVGLQNAIKKNYKRKPTPALMAKLSKTWAPYRSYASRLLWKSLDNEPK